MQGRAAALCTTKSKRDDLRPPPRSCVHSTGAHMISPWIYAKSPDRCNASGLAFQSPTAN
eukprot:542067-Pyramimonas_sp.AAC.1